MTTPSCPSEATIRETLQQVLDPELGCNIIDLGLVYGIESSGSRITVKMTLTTPGCPMHESITYGVQMALLRLDEVEDVDVQLVWDPPWNPAMMTSAGRTHLGIRD